MNISEFTSNVLQEIAQGIQKASENGVVICPYETIVEFEVQVSDYGNKILTDTKDHCVGTLNYNVPLSLIKRDGNGE